MLRLGDRAEMGCCRGGSRRCAVKIASNSKQCRQTDFCIFCSTHVHSCQVSQKDHLVRLCPQVVGVIFASRLVTVAVRSCEQGGGTHGERTLLQEGLGRRWPERQSTRTILGKNKMPRGGVFLKCNTCCVIQCNI